MPAASRGCLCGEGSGWRRVVTHGAMHWESEMTTTGGGTLGRAGGRRFLIDTNILIALEDHIASQNANGAAASRFAASAAGLGFTLVVAQGSKKDFLRAPAAQRETRLRQLTRYHVLGDLKPSANQRARFRVDVTASANDQCDLEIVCALDNQAAEYLVTEDRRLRRRASSGGLADRVLSLADALAYLEALEGKALAVPHVQRVSAYQISGDLEILDSLRDSYHGFDAWWRKAQAESRDVLLVGTVDDPDALCVLKVETGPPSNVAGTAESLKLCTFKVADRAPGNKYGELLLKAAVDEARGRGLSSMFVTVMPDKTDMVAFLERFGFVRVEDAVTGVPDEIVLEKRLLPVGQALRPLDHAITYGPGSAVAEKAYIVPIQPRYVVELLPEAQESIGLGVTVSSRACGNAIRKAYLCNTRSRSVGPGDLLCFYMSRTERAVVATGVVEQTLVSRDPRELIDFVGVRTVYTEDEVSELTRAGEVLAVLFRFDRVVTPPMTFTELVSEGVLKAAPRSFTEVSPQKVGQLCQRLLT